MKVICKEEDHDEMIEKERERQEKIIIYSDITLIIIHSKMKN